MFNVRWDNGHYETKHVAGLVQTGTKYGLNTDAPVWSKCKVGIGNHVTHKRDGRTGYIEGKSSIRSDTPCIWRVSWSDGSLSSAIHDDNLVAGHRREDPEKARREATRPDKTPSVYDRQEGGDHYHRFKIQPLQYAVANKLDFNQGSIVKYVTRHALKGKVGDLKKAIQHLRVMLQEEYGVRSDITYFGKE